MTPGFLPKAVGMGQPQGEGLWEEAKMTSSVYLRCPGTQPGRRPGLKAEMVCSAVSAEVGTAWGVCKASGGLGGPGPPFVYRAVREVGGLG